MPRFTEAEIEKAREMDLLTYLMKERKWTWGLKSIKYCDLSSETKMCMTVPGKDDGKAEGIFRILTIIDMDNLRYSFAFDEKHEETAKYISNRIKKRPLSK